MYQFRLPLTLYTAICDNEAQREEWVKLFAIDRIADRNDSPCEEQIDIELDGENQKEVYSVPLSEKFLEENQNLVLDTRFFGENFKNELLSSISQKDDFDDQCDGLLIHSENFQALRLLKERYREQIQCIYIDPPYNTAATEILYKNNYKHSSWLSLLHDRISSSHLLLQSNGIIEIAIDKTEHSKLELITKDIFGDSNFISTIAIMNNPKGRDQEHIAESHDYTIIAAKDITQAKTGRLKLSEAEIIKKYPKFDGKSRFRELPLRRAGNDAQRNDRPKMYFPFILNKKTKELSVIPRNEYDKIYSGGTFDDTYVESLKKKYEKNGYIFVLPIRNDGSKGRWRWGYDKSVQGCSNEILFTRGDPLPTIYQKDYAEETYLPKSLWYGSDHDSSSKGTNLLNNIIGSNPFEYPKSLLTVKDLLEIGLDEGLQVLDYFAGSGTTGHAVINLNREDEGRRKYVLVEMGDYFDTVLKPRIQKVIYSPNWKDGKPENRETGISHCFKYIRLESYEDTLNNLDFKNNAKQNTIFKNNAKLNNDYMLNYMLAKESEDSLLNIDNFKDPCSYKLKIKSSGSLEQKEHKIDLVETFNYLIGLRVERIYKQQQYNAELKHMSDKETPTEESVNGIIDCILEPIADGSYWFHTIKGNVPRKRFHPNGELKKVLIIWRNLSDDLISDNIVLNSWFKEMIDKNGDWKDVDLIYVNGCSALSKIKNENDSWDVLSIEQKFNKLMFEVRE